MNTNNPPYHPPAPTPSSHPIKLEDLLNTNFPTAGTRTQASKSKPPSPFIMYGLYQYIASTPTANPTPPPLLLQDGHDLHPLREVAMNHGHEVAGMFNYTAVPNLAWGAGELRGGGEWVDLMDQELGRCVVRFNIERVVVGEGGLRRAAEGEGQGNGMKME
ncbi:hypothetical protein K491DRAFT_712662 [Lophiostoma macrostomum CBS 122681]|uniref:Uncharacterized protein n=1 Tax=Lophiostoma macrostomum CBS 122681 TaxID=1314788 RepID=A0A6A6THK5_9PLEO|nr:hypothetical protein K491DRAFT_712662 [Lophiostoma macrostomum CBS 122681]